MGSASLQIFISNFECCTYLQVYNVYNIWEVLNIDETNDPYSVYRFSVEKFEWFHAVGVYRG